MDMGAQPKSLLKGLSQAISQEIAALDLPSQPANLYEPITYLMGLGGKRLRPMLVLLGAGASGANPLHWLKPAIALEVFHNFTLMHDDIMDQAPLRRGLPTVHAKWNPNVAILSGDVMLVEAYELLLHAPQHLLHKIIGRFNRTAAEVCEGQQLDMDFESLPTVSVDTYINMIRLKTAVLLGFSLELGASIAGAEDLAIQTLYHAGVDLGISFQLMDDYLDCFGDPDKFGKQVGGDIIANKKTYLLINALERAEGQIAELLNQWLQIAGRENEKVTAVSQIYRDLGIDTLTQDLMTKYYESGVQKIKSLPANEYQQALLAFSEALFKRDH